MSLKPLGIFWDINNCLMPNNMSVNDFVRQLRDYLIIKFNNNCVEYLFCCASNPKLLNISVTQSLNLNGVDILNVDSNCDTGSEQRLSESIEKFVDHHGFDSLVVIITSRINFIPVIRSTRRKEVFVLLIYGNQTANGLIASANESVAFDQVFKVDNNSVVLSLSNLPTNQSRKVIRKSFMPFCESFNCKFRSQKKGFAKLVFTNIADAERAELALNGLEFFGQQLIVEYEETVPNTYSSNLSLVSSEVSTIPPQNDDNCKSVIIGLYSKKNENVVQKVRKIVMDWNENDINEEMIYRVNRERSFAQRDGKATLIVTAINPEINNKLLSIAKYRFVNREKKIYWNRLRRSQKELNNNRSETQCLQNELNQLSMVRKEVSDDFKSVITGLWTRHDENVLDLVRSLVKSWNCHDFDLKHIICVDREKKFHKNDGKAILIVSTDSIENNKKLLSYASKMFCNKRKKLFWKPLEAKQSSDCEQQVKQSTDNAFNSSCVDYLPIKKEMTYSYAEIAANSYINSNINVTKDEEQDSKRELKRLSCLVAKRRDDCICK